MTQKLAVNANNDLFLDSNSNLAVYRGLDAVAQQCEHVMKILIGELVFDTQRGLLSFRQDGVFGNSPDLTQFEFRGRNLLLAVADVTDVEDFQFEVVDNTLQYTATIKTIYGTRTIGSELFS